jgi:hypothetical protein
MTTLSPVGVRLGVGTAVAVATGGESVGGTELSSGAKRDFAVVGVTSRSLKPGSGVANVTSFDGGGTEPARSRNLGSSSTTRSGKPNSATSSRERPRLDTFLTLPDACGDGYF